MKQQNRNEYILQKVIQDGYLSISDAAKSLNVSTETIRRDIAKLSKAGMIRKIRGGAEPLDRQLRKDAPRPLRLYENEDEKNRVGSAAALMVKDNSIVGLDGGISVQIMVNHISNAQNVTFITNSLPIATILSDKLFRKEITGRLIFIGGEIDIESRYSCGALTYDALKPFNFDQVFLSCSALSKQGASDYKTEGSVFSSILATHSIQTILLAEKDKLGKNSLYKYAELTDFDYIVLDTPSSVPSDMTAILAKSATQIIYAS